MRGITPWEQLVPVALVDVLQQEIAMLMEILLELLERLKKKEARTKVEDALIVELKAFTNRPGAFYLEADRSATDTPFVMQLIVTTEEGTTVSSRCSHVDCPLKRM